MRSELSGKRQSIRGRGIAAALVAILVLAGCGSTQGSARGGSEKAAVPLAEATLVDDPKSYVGGSHASMSAQKISPIAEAPAPALPVTVTDSQGTKVTIKDASRILALDLYGTLARTVFELGLGDSVVGRDLSADFPEAADLPLVTGEGHDIVAEKILALNPSVILTDTSLGPWNIFLQMRDAGIPVVVMDSKRSIENIEELTTSVASALGVPDIGVQLAERIMAEVKAQEAEIAAVAPTAVQDKLRTVFLYARGQSGVYYMFGEGSGADGLIDAVGGYDVAEEINWSGMKPVTDEGLIAAQPELILMMTKGLTSVGGIDGLLERLPAIAQTPAGKNKRIVDMVDSAILGYGPRTAEVMNSLAVAIYAPESAEPSGGSK